MRDTAPPPRRADRPAIRGPAPPCWREWARSAVPGRGATATPGVWGRQALRRPRGAPARRRARHRARSRWRCPSPGSDRRPGAWRGSCMRSAEKPRRSRSRSRTDLAQRDDDLEPVETGHGEVQEDTRRAWSRPRPSRPPPRRRPPRRPAGRWIPPARTSIRSRCRRRRRRGRLCRDRSSPGSGSPRGGPVGGRTVTTPGGPRGGLVVSEHPCPADVDRWGRVFQEAKSRSLPQSGGPPAPPLAPRAEYKIPTRFARFRDPARPRHGRGHDGASVDPAGREERPHGLSGESRGPRGRPQT